MNIDLEAKRKRIELLMKLLALGVAGFFVAPIILLTIKGIIGLVAAAAITLFVVNVAGPWFAVKIANWRLKALKHEASLNPIETLENQEQAKQEALGNIRTNIEQLYAVVEDLRQQIQEHDRQYPGRPSQFLEKYDKLKQLAILRGEKFKQAQKSLKEFHELIEEKRTDWKIAQTCAAASKLANVGEDFQSKLMQDTAFSSIQDGLNTAFSELDMSLLDAQADSKDVEVVTSLPAAKPVAAITNGSELPCLDADNTTEARVRHVELDPVPTRASRRSR